VSRIWTKRSKGGRREVNDNEWFSCPQWNVTYASVKWVKHFRGFWYKGCVGSIPQNNVYSEREIGGTWKGPFESVSNYTSSYASSSYQSWKCSVDEPRSSECGVVRGVASGLVRLPGPQHGLGRAPWGGAGYECRTVAGGTEQPVRWSCPVVRRRLGRIP
jgi:hypothetical protein